MWQMKSRARIVVEYVISGLLVTSFLIAGSVTGFFQRQDKTGNN